MRVLITGNSGSGKSTVGSALRECGYFVIDADTDVFGGLSVAYFRDRDGRGVNVPWPLPVGWERRWDWVWRVEVLRLAMFAHSDRTVVVCGSADNEDEAYGLFDVIIVLWADTEILAHRVSHRIGNDFGKAPHELEHILARDAALLERAVGSGAVLVDTCRPIRMVVEEIVGYLETT